MSLSIGEEHILRLFENKVLMRLFEPKRDEVTGGLRKLHKEELRDLYSSPSIIQMIKSRGMRCVRACSTNGGEEESIWVIGRKA
jgi:hypothetical protein